MKHLKIAYAMNASLPDITREDARRLTHLNLAFGLIREGMLDLSGLGNIGLVPRIRKWNPSLRIVLSVGGWGAGGFSEMARTEEGRWEFARSVRRAVDEHDLDGVDIDWEYPCSDLAGIVASPRDRENFTHLLRALRRQLGPERILSIAAGAGEYFVRGTQMDQVAKLTDYVQLMTYDMRSGFCRQAGHHAALTATAGDDSGLNTCDVVRMFQRAGVPAKKIVVGAAFYARRWLGVPNVNHGLLQQAGSVGLGGPHFDEITDEFIEKNRFEQFWDADAQAAYLWNGSEFISFETPEAIRLKCEYVRREGLLGIMYWEHGCDSTRALLGAIDAAFAGERKQTE